MKKRNIKACIIKAIENLYDKTKRVALFDVRIGFWLKTTVEIRQRCLLSTTVFKIRVERLISQGLGDHKCSVSIEGFPFPRWNDRKKKPVTL